MSKKILLLSVFIFGFSLYAQTACPTFKYLTSGLDPKAVGYADKAETDVAQLEEINTCVAKNALAIRSSKTVVKKDDYLKPYDDAVKLDNAALSLAARLTDAQSKLNTGVGAQSYRGQDSSKVVAEKLTDKIARANAVEDNARKLSQGTFKLMQDELAKTAEPVTAKDITNGPAGWWETATPGSIASALKNAKTPEDQLAVLDTKDYSLDDFKYSLDTEKLMPAKKKLAEEKTDPNALAKKDDAKSDEGLTQEEKDLKIAQKKLADAQLAALQNGNGNPAPFTGGGGESAAGKESGGGGGGSGLGGSLLGGRGGFSEKDREDMKKERDQRTLDTQREALRRALTMKSPAGRQAFSRQGFDYARMKDVLDDKDKTKSGASASRKSITDDFMGGDTEQGQGRSGWDKYKEYFKGGNAPGASSSSDYWLNRFGSMYETARLKALTEGADTQFAGRYVDIFLLVHSILDHQYRDKGNLMDMTEVVPSPLGGNI